MSQARPKAAPREVGLPEKVDFLRRPDSYPEPTRQVEAKETHMSWVFLTEAHAYKLKKPVRYPFLDFSTIALRKMNCEEEVRLNRRLAPDVYLGVVSLGLDEVGRLCLDGGSAVDWLVKMRRLAAERTLEQAIRSNAIREDDILRLGRRLAAFYKDAPRAAMGVADYRARLSADIEANESALRTPGYGLPVPIVESVAAALRRYVADCGDELDRRVRDGRIVEGHGDLRPEHVYLGAEPLVTDCLEFNRDFRILDPVDELGYLAMECERESAPQVGPWLFKSYGEASGDAPPAGLVAFYEGFRAFLRAKIAIWHLDEPEPRDGAKWRPRAVSYLRIAQAQSARFS
jgi:aminoglycoside phosphotransferase family enzyme